MSLVPENPAPKHYAKAEIRALALQMVLHELEADNATTEEENAELYAQAEALIDALLHKDAHSNIIETRIATLAKLLEGAHQTKEKNGAADAVACGLAARAMAGVDECRDELEPVESTQPVKKASPALAPEPAKTPEPEVAEEPKAEPRQEYQPPSAIVPEVQQTIAAQTPTVKPPATEPQPKTLKPRTAKPRAFIPREKLLHPSPARTSWLPKTPVQEVEAAIPNSIRSVLKPAASAPATPIDPAARYEISAVIGLGLTPMKGRVADSVYERLNHVCNHAFAEYKSAGHGVNLAEIQRVRALTHTRANSPLESSDGMAAHRAVTNILDTALATLSKIEPISKPSASRTRQYSPNFRPAHTTPTPSVSTAPKATHVAKIKPASPLSPREPSSRAFENRWNAINAYCASIDDMEANAVTQFIADGPKTALNMDKATFDAHCRTARQSLGWLDVDSKKAQRLIDALAAAHESHHQSREAKGQKIA